MNAGKTKKAPARTAVGVVGLGIMDVGFPDTTGENSTRPTAETSPP